MISAKRTRVDRLERQVLVTDWQQAFEFLRRFHFNLIRVSDAALTASLVAGLEGKALPDWVDTEFQQPIPAGAARARVREAEEWARGAPRGEFQPSTSRREASDSLEWLTDRAAQAGFDDLMQYAEHLRYADTAAEIRIQPGIQ